MENNRVTFPPAFKSFSVITANHETDKNGDFIVYPETTREMRDGTVLIEYDYKVDRER